ncbi:MAG: Na(+)-translocating NADH-quinone reductase subunit C [Gammaproteobacteria bacterium]|nr:MAG: Na(+)-translocating NADH-quinone reductase subunit C [Gammaproteobacteria bacterium]
MSNSSHKSKETFSRTLIFVFIICLVCAALVSVSAISLKPLQKANRLLDQHTKILEAAGLSDVADKNGVDATFAKFVTAKFVNLATGDFTTGDHETYNERTDARDTAKSSAVKDTKVGLRRRADKAVIYLVKNDQGSINSVVLPIVGMGLWDIMYGYVGLEADLNTAKRVVYYDLKETPGLGAEVQNPKWKAKWKGKKMFDDKHNIAIQIVKGGAKKGDIHGVDALSGATLTSRGVNRTIHFWLGDEGYGPFIAKFGGKLNNGGLN